MKPLRDIAAGLPCSFCNAAPDEPCRGELRPADQVLGFHPERRRAALALRDKQERSVESAAVEFARKVLG